MKIEIVSSSDELFKIGIIETPSLVGASDGDHIVVAETKEEAIELLEEVVSGNTDNVVTPERFTKPKIAAPLENAKGLGWFDGTSWGTK